MIHKKIHLKFVNSAKNNFALSAFVKGIQRYNMDVNITDKIAFYICNTMINWIRYLKTANNAQKLRSLTRDAIDQRSLLMALFLFRNGRVNLK